MGPPSEDGGNSMAPSQAAGVPLRFNGAAVRRRRKFLGRSQVEGDMLKLQWGRRPKTAEIGFFLWQHALCRALQWGRRPKTAEISLPPSPSFPQKTLQWGRRPKTAEIGKVFAGCCKATCASMGPPSEDGGNRPYR